MKIFFSTMLVLIFVSHFCAKAGELQNPNRDLTIVYKDAGIPDMSKQALEAVITTAERDVRLFFPNMTRQIQVRIELVDWDLSTVGGVSGMAVRHAPTAEIVIYLSTKAQGGVSAVISQGLRPTMLHELHHIARGWAIEDNKFGPGIHIAAVNEGLAVVFGELLSGASYPANRGPDDVHQWVMEIMRLPEHADYMQWVSGEHPDGRSAIGYKAGRYIVYQALQHSQKNIIELSRLPVDQILALSKTTTQ